MSLIDHDRADETADVHRSRPGLSGAVAGGPRPIWDLPLPGDAGLPSHSHLEQADDSEDLGIGEEENPEQFKITSIGVDIGSATSHLMVSRLTMRRLGKGMLSSYIVVDRQVIYLSPVMLTPYRESGLIDADGLQGFVANCLAESTLAIGDIDTGVVLLTGEALRRENARAIASQLSDAAGRFVCASAGHHLEARVAAYGSGAVELSRERESRVLNIDIGGGTTKLALIDRGEIRATGAINVGGRLIATDHDQTLTRTEPAGVRVAEAEGVELVPGGRLEVDDAARIAARLAACLAEVLAGEEPLTPLAQQLLLTERVSGTRAVDAVMLSGGVSEYLSVDGTASASFGDLAKPLASALSGHLARIYGGRVQVSQVGLRATVVGLSQFTVEASGDTIYLSSPGILPIRNIPMVHVSLPDDLDDTDVAKAITEAVNLRDLLDDELSGIALDWSGVPRYAALVALVDGLRCFLARNVRSGHPAVVVVSQDCARSLGHLLHEHLGASAEVVCIDGLSLGEFDFVDIGAMVPGKTVVPIVVKSLLFPTVVP